MTATPASERDRLAEQLDQAYQAMTEAQQQRDAARAELDATLAVRSRELATARRDTAAATLEEAASFARSRAADETVPTARRQMHSEYAATLDALATEIRTGQRDVPGADGDAAEWPDLTAVIAGQVSGRPRVTRETDQP